ncbi:MAG: 50S ribosomal protein L10 [Candidatus Omnitrophota bacterium]
MIGNKHVTDYKERIAQALGKDFKGAESVFVAELKGVKGGELVQLRREMKAIGGRFLVVKNSLAKIALEKTDYKPLAELLKGTIGLGLSGEDAIACSKMLVGFAKNRETFIIKGALLDGSLVGPTEIKTLAALPSREVLLTQLVSTLQSPIRGLAFVLNENIRKLACLLNEIANKKK